MDEPFSALDVLTAETLRGELLELLAWPENSHPRDLYRHSQHRGGGSAGRSRDRAGEQPGEDPRGFEIALPQPRNRKSVPFETLVDHIYSRSDAA